MTKEEKIKEVYEYYGFNWNECKKYISNDGILVLPTPDLKYSLKGYENLIKDEEKLSSFGKDGLKLQPSLLKGMFNNNGWIKIESEDDFPKKNGAYWTITKGKNEVEANTFGTFGKKEFTFHNGLITHYQPIEKPKPPIY